MKNGAPAICPATPLPQIGRPSARDRAPRQRRAPDRYRFRPALDLDSRECAPTSLTSAARVSVARGSSADASRSRTERQPNGWLAPSCSSSSAAAPATAAGSPGSTSTSRACAPTAAPTSRTSCAAPTAACSSTRASASRCAIVSRVFTHELVRHRAGSAFSQESLRYVRLTDIGFRVPPALEPVRERVLAIVEQLEEFQREAAEQLGIDDDGVPFHVKKEATSALRRLAPIGLSTDIIWTANVRTLRHVIEMRTALAPRRSSGSSSTRSPRSPNVRRRCSSRTSAARTTAAGSRPTTRSERHHPARPSDGARVHGGHSWRNPTRRPTRCGVDGERRGLPRGERSAANPLPAPTRSPGRAARPRSGRAAS
jgi:hypothetical protein